MSSSRMPEEVVRNTSFSGGNAMKYQFIHSFIIVDVVFIVIIVVVVIVVVIVFIVVVVVVIVIVIIVVVTTIIINTCNFGFSAFISIHIVIRFNIQCIDEAHTSDAPIFKSTTVHHTSDIWNV